MVKSKESGIIVCRRGWGGGGLVQLIDIPLDILPARIMPLYMCYRMVA